MKRHYVNQKILARLIKISLLRNTLSRCDAVLTDADYPMLSGFLFTNSRGNGGETREACLAQVTRIVESENFSSSDVQLALHQEISNLDARRKRELALSASIYNGIDMIVREHLPQLLPKPSVGHALLGLQKRNYEMASEVEFQEWIGEARKIRKVGVIIDENRQIAAFPYLGKVTSEVNRNTSARPRTYRFSHSRGAPLSVALVGVNPSGVVNGRIVEPGVLAACKGLDRSWPKLRNVDTSVKCRFYDLQDLGSVAVFFLANPQTISPDLAADIMNKIAISNGKKFSHPSGINLFGGETIVITIDIDPIETSMP